MGDSRHHDNGAAVVGRFFASQKARYVEPTQGRRQESVSYVNGAEKGLLKKSVPERVHAALGPEWAGSP